MSKFVTVGSFTSPWEAHIAKGFLESEGIPVVVRNEHHIAANWMLSNALGGVLLQVTEDNAVRALKALDSVREGEAEKAIQHQFADMPENLCPECGSIKFNSQLSIGTIILLVCTLGVAGIIFPPRREKHTCIGCGTKWKY